MLERQLIINSTHAETRIALIEKEHVAELFIERAREKSLVGNIYKGVVTRVLPGMQSAFVDIGLGRAAFLFGGDVLPPDITALNVGGEKNSSDEIEGDDIEEKIRQSRVPIEKILREGQHITVQVAKDPLGSKGARVRMLLSLPGRYSVFMPFVNHVGISRKIDDQSERQRLGKIVAQNRQDNCGVIVRTAAKGVEDELLARDLRYVGDTWRLIHEKIDQSKAPSLLFEDFDILLRVARDAYSDDVSKIVVDQKEARNRLVRFLDATTPGASAKVELYDGGLPLFDVYGIELDIGKALQRRIDLPSGGYLVVDQTEALTSFDVNTGKYVGRASASDTILRTNLEAVRQIVAQLRIRNIGGIIVLDFIDMDRLEDRERVFQTLQEELKHDRARTNVLKISELGLVQMTRKRTSESLERILLESCPFCDGRGRVKSVPSEAYDLMREILRRSIQTSGKHLKVRIREDIKDWILEEEKDLLADLQKHHGITVEFLPNQLNLQNLQEPTFEVVSSL